MPKVKVIQSNFSAGELSPRAMGRVDIARYPITAKRMKNVISRTLGGAEKRPGTEFIEATKDSTKKSRLIPYVLSRTASYMLEFGDLYMRVFLPDGTPVMDGAVPYEIATPYNTAAVALMDFAQSEDAMYLFHQDVFPSRIRTFANDYWDCSPAPFTATPFDEVGDYFAVALTLSLNTVGIGRTISAADAVFMSADVGRAIIQGSGVAVITGYVDSKTVTVEVKSVFESTSIPSGEWNLDSSPQVSITPSIKEPVGASVTITASSTTTYTTEAAKTITGLSHLISSRARVTIVGHGYSTGQVVEIAGCVPSGYNGRFTVTVVDADTFTYPLSPSPGGAYTLGNAARVTSSTSALDGFRAGDVGKFIRMNGGLLKIIQFTDAQHVTAEILKELSAVTPAPAMAWTLEGPMWNSASGYPRTGTMFEQRLVAAGSHKYPQTVWGSRTGEELDFTKGTADDDAFIFTVANEANLISFLVSSRNLLLLTYGGEYSLNSGSDKPITPTNVQIKPQSPHGCGTVRPVRVGKETLFAQRAGKRLRAMGYKYDEDGYKSPDITTLSEHLAETGVAGMCLQQEPDPLVWVWMNNGMLVSITFDRDLDVIAVTWHETLGAVESVAVVPSDESEQVWMIVRRSVNGSIVRYVERMRTDWYPVYGTVPPDTDIFPPQPQPFSWGFQLDCAITDDDATGKATWDGLDHLENETVHCIADGVHMGTFVVSSGSITLPRNAKRGQIGLPFYPEIITLTPEIQGATGTIQGDAMSTNRVTARLYRTMGCTVNGQEIAAGRTIGPDQFDTYPAPFTGDKDVSTIGWAKGVAEITISQNDPLPFHLLAIIREITINGG